MSLRWYAAVVDSLDIAARARWWAETLDHRIVHEDEHEVATTPRGTGGSRITDRAAWATAWQGLVFVPVPEGNELCIPSARDR